MSETEKQEGQKTVVAFITGLLIGGLLVWVFSSTPDSAPVGTPDEQESTVGTDSENSTDTEGNGSAAVTSSEVVRSKTATVAPVGEGSITVANQKAGNAVSLGALEYPSDMGWVVVRELMDGVPANVLGAARFGLDEGLLPTEVPLQRNTVAGNSYLIVFYTEDGDKDFNLRLDRQIEGVSATFKAE